MASTATAMFTSVETFFSIRQISEKSPGAIFFVEASLVNSATASFLSNHLAAFYPSQKPDFSRGVKISTGSTSSYSSISCGTAQKHSSEWPEPATSGTAPCSGSLSCSDLTTIKGLADAVTLTSSASNSFFLKLSRIFSKSIDFTGSLPIHRQSSSVSPLAQARTF
nr:hypothetical protein Iba_chr06bCG4910 [Ipomoea batatas]